MELNVYLYFNGNCEEAMEYYANATGGTVDTLVRYGESPVSTADEHADKILHGVLRINHIKIMCSDDLENHLQPYCNNYALSMNFGSEEKLRQTFNNLAGEGKVTMPIQDTFWGAVFGKCTDKYGVNWMFSYDKPKRS